MTTTALVTGLVLAGCGADDRKSGQSSAAGVADSGGKRAVLEPAQAGGVAQDVPAQAPDLGIDQRSIVYRGEIAVRVKDVTAAAATVTGIASTAGGFLGSDNRSSGDGDDTATMELRVPADKFATVVDQLSRLGVEQSRQISTEDVTEQSIDLDARIAVQQARVDSGRKLLSQAKSLSDLVMLEREVATRESDLASLLAKKRHVADLVALSTISITLLNPTAVIARTDAGAPGFLGGLKSGWHALLASLAVLLTVLGALLPWLIGLGLPLWALALLTRRLVRTRRTVRLTAGKPPTAAADQQLS